MRTVFLSCHFGDSDRELVRQGKDRWTWSVWIDGPPERLDEIEYVEYILHPTFREPVRRVADRSSQFRLNSRGWGEFTIHANVITHAGQKLRLDHWLKLEDVGTSAGIRELAAGKLTIFVSYSRADYPLAAELCRFRSDAMLALIADEPGRWVLNEIFEAQKQQVPVISVLLGKEAGLPAFVANQTMVRIENPRDPQEAIRVVELELAKLKL